MVAVDARSRGQRARAVRREIVIVFEIGSLYPPSLRAAHQGAVLLDDVLSLGAQLFSPL